MILMLNFHNNITFISKSVSNNRKFSRMNTSIQLKMDMNVCSVLLPQTQISHENPISIFSGILTMVFCGNMITLCLFSFWMHIEILNASFVHKHRCHRIPTYNNMVENSPETEFVSLHFRFTVGAICLFANYSFYTYKILKRNRKRRWRERLADTEKSRWIGNTGILLYKHTDTYTKSIRSVALNMCSCILILIYCVSKKLRHL